MASPQKENGFTPIANEILEILARTKLNGTQRRILDIILRSTWGYNRKSYTLSDSYLAKSTNINIKQIGRELRKLMDSNIVAIYYSGDRVKPREIGLNKNYNEWLMPTNEKEGTSEIVDKGTSELVPKVPSKKKDKKENININKKEKYISILDYWNVKEIVKHSFTDSMAKSIEVAFKSFGKDNIIRAIDNYSKVYHDSDFYYSHIWRLDKFLKQSNGLPNFLDDGQLWLNYISQSNKEEINPIYNLNGR